MSIFLVPRSNEISYKNFLSTIENGVDYSLIKNHLSDEGKIILSGKGKLFVWGNKESKKKSWDKMEYGDHVLFYKGREGDEQKGKFLYSGTLLFKQHSKELGLALWAPKTGEEPWTCIFFLEDLKQINLPISDMTNLAGYSSNFVVQGFMPLSKVGVKNIISKYGTIEKFLDKYSQNIAIKVSDLDHIPEITAHAEAEMLILKIGMMLGYDTYSSDKTKGAFGEKIDDYCTLKQIPTRFLGELVSIYKEIDVIWFKDNVPMYAFEVEHATKFGAGFQRLFQLNPSSAKLFIVSSQKNYPLFAKFIETDPYYRHKKDFFFRSYSHLEEYFRAVSEFEAINKIFLEKEDQP